MNEITPIDWSEDLAFRDFGKISRWSRPIVITEKIDGTNAQILIQTVPSSFWLASDPYILATMQNGDGGHGLGFQVMKAGSRNRWVKVGDDNAGFAGWVVKNSAELFQLGDGRHFGEWWGSGIQRGYGLTKGEKRFSLFNVSRWTKVSDTLALADKQQIAPSCCSVVPTLYAGPVDDGQINGRLSALGINGSAVAPGFMKPEGIIIYHTAANVYYKKTFEKDDSGKWEK